MNQPKPFTPEALADRWEVGPAAIRKMIRTGQIRAFKAGGKLWRIPAAEVERIECTPSNDSVAAGPSSGEMQKAFDAGLAFPRPLGSKRKSKPASAGESDQPAASGAWGV